MKQVIKSIQNDQHFRFTYDSRPMNENMKRYSEFYNLPTENIMYRYGFESFVHERLFIQSFRPLPVKAHILLLHGYYDHAGVLSTVIRFLIQQGFHVLTFDLPGHGLSTGERGAISEFSLYTESIREVVRRHLSSSSLPVYIVAHSTGAAAAVDYILNNPETSQVRKAVLVSPLVRPYRWNAITILIKPLKTFTRNLKRMLRNNSSDAKFLRFVKNDPLQHDQVPLSWVEALIRWNELIKKGNSSSVPVLILQGKKDTTVDWRYNVGFLLKKFPNIEVELIENGKHHLLNEEELIRDKVFSSIHRYLTDDV
ncbi:MULTISPECIES: alpha/beta hydrolase [Priestia]|nr:alpha/beta hydrolase [Priestia megaterium]MBD8847757.1 alpha/beta hydrolase [Priestia megaterium]MCF6799469.1 alpha/beta hydrolase [Bacillus sp. ET1]MDN4866025.1 alpha/beta hydrolase [Priestia megaterium]MED4184771.1 alpha/beta hydrolase [Priestia megaterium]